MRKPACQSVFLRYALEDLVLISGCYKNIVRTERKWESEFKTWEKLIMSLGCG